MPQLPYQERDVPRIENIDDDDDNDDDDDDERKEYERFKNIKKVLKEEGCLEKLVENETNKLYISLRNLKNKKYVIKREDANLLCQKPFNNDYLKLMSKYYNRKINSKYIIDLKKLVDDGIKLYYEDKSWRDAVAKNKIINSQKVSADLQRIIDAIKSNKFHRPGDFIKNPLSTNLSWMQDQDYYQEINNEIQNSFNTDGEYDAFPLLKEFLSNINDGTINNRKTAREYINDLKDESSSSIYLNVSKLEVAIFGPAKNWSYNRDNNYENGEDKDDDTDEYKLKDKDDNDEDDDEDDDEDKYKDANEYLIDEDKKQNNYQKGIAERAKTEGRNKISNNQFKNYEMGHKELDKIPRSLIGKNINPIR